MRHILAIFAALFFCANAHAQTVKALAYNTTNGQVVYSGTNTLTFSNTLLFGDDVSGNAFESSSGSNSVRFDADGVTFGGSAAATTRTNLGLGLPALTNTSNSTMMRALSGSTNTSHPYSGTVALTNTNAVLTFSNGILQSVQ